MQNRVLLLACGGVRAAAGCWGVITSCRPANKLRLLQGSCAQLVRCWWSWYHLFQSDIWNLIGHLVPPHTDHCRWSLGLQVKPHELGCTRKSKSPLFAIIQGTVSAYRSGGKKKAKLGATNGAVLRSPPVPSSSTAKAQSFVRFIIFVVGHSGTLK